MGGGQPVSPIAGGTRLVDCTLNRRGAPWEGVQRPKKNRLYSVGKRVGMAGSPDSGGGRGKRRIVIAKSG